MRLYTNNQNTSLSTIVEENPVNDQGIAFARWIKRNLPANSRVFVHDWPGMMAFYSDLCIVPADGLMMDYSFNDDVIKLGIMEYFQLNHRQVLFGSDRVSFVRR